MCIRFAGRRRFVAVFATATFVFGIASPAGAAPPPAGYERVSVKAAGISVVLPDTWAISKMTREQARAVVDANPQLGVTVDDVMKRQSLTATWDGDADSYPDRWMGVQVLADTSSLPSPADVRSELHGVIPNAATTRSKVAGTPAIEIKGSATITRDDGNDVVAYVRAYAFVAHRKLVMVQYMRVQPDDPEFEQMTTTMVKNVALLK